MRSACFLLSAALACSVVQTEGAGKERVVVRVVDDLRAYVDERLHVTLRNDTNRIVYVPVIFLERLEACVPILKHDLDNEEYKNLVSGAPLKNVRKAQKQLERLLCLHPETQESMHNELEELIVYDKSGGVPTGYSVYRVIEMARYFQYVRLERLCRDVFSCLFYEFIDVDTLLVLVRRGANREDIHNMIKYAQHVVEDAQRVAEDTQYVEEDIQNTGAEDTQYVEEDIQNTVVEDFLSQCVKKQEEELEEFDLERKYKDAQKEYEFVWQTSPSVFQMLISEKRVLSVLNDTCYELSERVEDFVKRLRTLLIVRSKEYPSEMQDYMNLIGLVFINRKWMIGSTEVLPCVFSINPIFLMNEEEYYSKWNRLIVNNETNLSVVLERPRSVNVLELGCIDRIEKDNLRVRTGNKIAVKDELVLFNLNEVVDFIDTSAVQRVFLIMIDRLCLYSNNLPAEFPNVRKISITKGSLDALIREENTLVFPNVEVIELTRCNIDCSKLKTVSTPAKTVYLTFCNYASETTLDDVGRALKNKNYYIKEDSCYRFSLNNNNEIRSRLKERHEIYNIEDYENKNVETLLELHDHVKTDTPLALREKSLRTDAKSLMVPIFYLADKSRETLKLISKDIVFGLVDTFEQFIRLADEYDMRNLRYLEVQVLTNETTRNTPTYEEKGKTREKHSIHTLIVKYTDKVHFKDVLIRTFDKNQLTCLEIRLLSNNLQTLNQNYSIANRQLAETLEYFTEIKVLSIKMNLNEGTVSSNRLVMSRIAQLRRLEVVEIAFAQESNVENFGEVLLDSVEEVLGGCTMIRRLTVGLDRTRKSSFRELRQRIRTKDSREYTLCVVNSFRKKGSSAKNEGVRRLSRVLYDKMVVEGVLCDCCNIKRQFMKSHVQCVYERVCHSTVSE